jgi:hypothetical protein
LDPLPLTPQVLANTGLQMRNVLQDSALKNMSMERLRGMDADVDGRVTKAEFMVVCVIHTCILAVHIYIFWLLFVWAE